MTSRAYRYFDRKKAACYTCCLLHSNMAIPVPMDASVTSTSENIADWMNLHWSDLGHFGAQSADKIGFIPGPDVIRRKLCDNCGSPGIFKVGNTICDKCVAELYDEEK